MNLIELTIWDERSKIYINPKYITSIYLDRINDMVFTRVELVNDEAGNGCLVKETPDEILKLI